MKICICGCNGRMGRMLVARALDTEACTLVGGIEHHSSPVIGRDIATLISRPPIGRLIEHEPLSLFDAADVIIDFSSPNATAAHADTAIITGKPLVVGTTDLESEQITALATAAQHVPVLYSPNMSLGMNVLFSLVEEVSRVLDESYDIEIFEIHHRTKVSAPSGTALELGRAAALGRCIDLSSSSQRIRDGYIGQRPKGHIGFSALRGGNVVGEHAVFFIADEEQVELTHKVNARDVFARGAIKAAFWLWKNNPGLYSMKDVLSLKKV